MTLENLQVQSYIVYEPEFVHRFHKITYRVTLERQSQLDGPDRWALYKGGCVLYKSEKEFAYESMPSSRTPEDLNDTRFDSPQEALDFWENEVKNKFEEEELKYLQTAYSQTNKIIHK